MGKAKTIWRVAILTDKGNVVFQTLVGSKALYKRAVAGSRADFDMTEDEQPKTWRVINLADVSVTAADRLLKQSLRVP